MKFRFEPTKDWTDFASGRVLYNYPGSPAFPARLASELFQRCAAYLNATDCLPPYNLYDPCCGGAHLLTVVGLLHGTKLRTISGSDVEPQALEFACKNLGLLRREGLEKRQEKLLSDAERFGKPSHTEAVVSAERLLALPVFRSDAPQTHVFRADAGNLNPHDLRWQPHILLADLPYGDLVQWQGDEQSQVLAGWVELVGPGGVIAVVHPKQQNLVIPAGLDVLESQKVGHRRFLIGRVE